MCRFLESYPKTRLSAVYGPTENTTFSTWMSLPTPEAIGVDVPIGRPIANSTAYVVDRHGEPAPIGIPGELWVGGDGVASGYLNLPERSQERFTEDPFAVAAAARVYKTGDRVRWRPDGVIEFLGRTDDQVKIRGFRIELGEIESVLQAHPGVSDAAVVAASHDGEKALYAFVVRNAFSTPSEAEFRAYLAAKLPRYMLPHAITIVSALPEHASGKIDRVSLARRATRAGSNVASPQPNSTPVRSQESRLRPVSTQRRIQETISSAWHDTLKLDAAPDLDMNFFDAGGDSLRLLRVHGILVERLGTDIQIMDLFEHTTIRSLAAFLNASSVTG
jgi:acyl-CoA synthetase (AMP-forming)/AMP-acid ligase II/acyl carrier protein